MPEFKIVLTGGGTAGHVMPHLALLPLMRQRGWNVAYIGSSGIEKGIVTAAGIPFHQIATGKLRRYLSWQNITDLGRIVVGTLQAVFILLRLRPNIIFSKGGFVSVPVAVAGWLCRIPVVTHESDLSPGLATRIIQRFAVKVLYSFSETEAYLPMNKRQHVQTPVRSELITGDRDRGERFCGFSSESRHLPTILIMGGSQGAQRINDMLLTLLPELVREYRIVHLTGKGKGLSFTHPNYRGFEFVGGELKDIFALADFVVSRAGANSVFELLSLRKPMLLIPLALATRGDQILNAESFAKRGWAHTLDEKTAQAQDLKAAIGRLVAAKVEMQRAQATYHVSHGGDVVEILAKAARP